MTEEDQAVDSQPEPTVLDWVKSLIKFKPIPIPEPIEIEEQVEVVLPPVEIRPVIEVSQEGENIQTIISDNGPGIPEEIRGILFEKGVSTTGSGFGLYLSKRVVEGYGGSIELISKNQGTAYRILLPIS